MADLEKNMLAEETSPYLRQHRDNPVHWQPWTADVLAAARAADRPILLSIGYAACHWCHVMAHESFEDDEVAAAMNRLFVPVKVDREERPDIDQIYMAALNATGEQGGWPLTMFLTPDGRPFWGGTYFPKTSRYGRPGFIDVLDAVHRTWSERKQELSDGADRLTAHVEASLAGAAARARLGTEQADALAEGIHRMMDPAGGGLAGAPKFPNAPFMEALWLGWLRDRDERYRDAVVLSLRRMLDGGIYDHIGGGLSRYSTDEAWLVPHFEKMLYDNAQLVALTCLAHGDSPDELFRIRIEETITFLLRDMRVEGGGFASSFDADSEGEEGRFYTWTEQQIVEVVGPAKAEFLLSAYSLAKPAHWEGDPVLHRPPDIAADPADPKLAEIRQALFEARARRVPPGRDDKVLVDWNGLAIAALAGAARQFQREEWLDAALEAYRFGYESMNEDGRLPHSILGRRRLFPGLSSDYAAMIRAAVALFEATGDDRHLEHARAWLDRLDRWYGDDAGTGYFLTAADAGDLPMRIRGDVDEAVPSATSQIIRALLALGIASGDAALQTRAYEAAEAALGRAGGQRHGQAGILNACALVLQPNKLLIVEEPSGDGLVAEANRYPDPRRVDVTIPVGSPEAPVLPGGTRVDASRPAAWLCRGQTCLLPITAPDELRRVLREA